MLMPMVLVITLGGRGELGSLHARSAIPFRARMPHVRGAMKPTGQQWGALVCRGLVEVLKEQRNACDRDVAQQVHSVIRDPRQTAYAIGAGRPAVRKLATPIAIAGL